MTMDLNALLKVVLREHPAAIELVKDFVYVAHLWDDLIDRDRPRSDEHINAAFWKALVDIPMNPFYQTHFRWLHPVVTTAITNWEAATRMEREGRDADLEISYITRSSYTDLIIQSAYLIGGREHAREVTPTIRRFIHQEGFAKYKANLKYEAATRG